MNATILVIGAHEEQGGADRLKDRRENQEAAERGDGRGRGKVEHFRKPVLQKQKPNDNAQNAEDIGPTLSILA